MAVIAGESSTLGYRTGSSGDYTPVGQRVSFSDEGRDREMVDTTVMPDTAGGVIHQTQRASNVVKAGSMALQVYYDPDDSTHEALTGLMVEPAATASRNWELKFATGATWTFAGYVTGFRVGGFDAAGTGNVVADVTITRTGAITIAKTPAPEPPPG